jgi:hypothetical protein
VDRDWFKGSNWATGNVPNGTDRVLVPFTANQPLISLPGAECLTLEIDWGSGAELEVASTSGGTLEVTQP